MSMQLLVFYLEESKSKVYKITIAIIFSGLLIFTIGCVTKPSDSDVDQSLITGNPCVAPCWYGLELGKSSTEDIRQVLPTLPFVDQSSISEKTVNNSSAPDNLQFTFKCAFLPKSTCGVLETSKEGVLSEIHIVINYPLDIGVIIEHLGTPQYYSYTGPLPQVGGCHVILFWTTKNIKAGIIENPGKILCKEFSDEKIDISLQIDYVIYTNIDLENIKNVTLPWPQINP